MRYNKAILFYHLVMMLLMNFLGFMFLMYEKNPLNLEVPFNYILGGVLVLYGLFRGYMAWIKFKSES